MHNRVIIAGGGTGGHVFPAIAIANALKKLQPGINILFVGARGKMEMEKVPQAGYPIVGLEIAGLNRSSWWKNILLPFKILRSLQQASRITTDFKPEAVVGVGGYASFPMLRRAQKSGIPTLIQEQNSYAGKTNQLMGKKAETICVAYSGMEKFFPAEKIVYTGNPVRANIADNKITREEACRKFSLDPAKQTLLVVGGSLGAKSINEAIAGRLEDLLAAGIQVVWQTGKLFAEEAATITAGKENQVKAMAFIEQMDYAYAAADVIISRAGSAIAELCLVKKPVVLVPYPYAAEDHQTQNALSLVHKDAALLVRDADTGTELVEKTLRLLKDKKMQEVLINHISELGIPDSDERIAREVLKLLN